MFVDPFATEVEWNTIERIASFKALDTWILFPTMAIMRIAPLACMPNKEHAAVLNRVYGNDNWSEAYHSKKQYELELFDREQNDQKERDPGSKKLIKIYKKQLRELYGNRFLKRSATFRNAKNAPLFEFIFCVGSPSGRAIGAAQRIAGHIIEHRKPSRANQ